MTAPFDAPLMTADELARELADPFPEFGLWTKKIPFLSPERTARIVERLKRHAVRSTNGKGCIEWAAARKAIEYGDYGKLNFRLSGGRHCQEYVHRLSWFLKTGKDLPDWMEVAHSCDNAPCFNPEHVEAQRRLANRRKSAENTNRKRRGCAAASQAAA